MHHIDHIRLSNHPDPRMRAAAARAPHLRAEAFRATFGQIVAGARRAARWLPRSVLRQGRVSARISAAQRAAPQPCCSPGS